MVSIVHPQRIVIYSSSALQSTRTFYRQRHQAATACMCNTLELYRYVIMAAAYK